MDRDRVPSRTLLDIFDIYARQLYRMVSKQRRHASPWNNVRFESALVPFLDVKLIQLKMFAEIAILWPHDEARVHKIRGDKWTFQQRNELHAVKAATSDGTELVSLYDAERLSIDHFSRTYNVPLKPWLVNIQLDKTLTIKVHLVAEVRQEKRKRGLKPGVKPKHKRRKAKGGEK
ncbi:hypothetical protein PHMEG_00036108 [Phytophthora megakarya]|uniref:Uncharacterized protein n=1 Tax=Phytophthora megakarya TaxID=4795 RepID=A0A225UMJ7_9STRA|nr:hypothetical protein PHMEG_00036108 [Phytophthora megakarya]